jgi:serine phosphatase RsbU (regulator of sigma subunit)
MFKHYAHNPNDPNSLSNNAIQGQAFFEDEEGFIWIGTYSGGIDRFEPKTGKFTHFTHNPQNKNPLPLPKEGVISFFGQHDVIWIGTDGHGLYSFNKYSYQVKKYTTEQGLSSDVVYAILPDGAGNLWLSTKNGLCRFNPDKETFKTYYDYHGLQSNVFYWGAAHRSDFNGEMYFGGISGFTYFNPKEIEDNRFVPPIYINEFKINNDVVPLGKLPDGRILLDKHISDTKRIELGYTDRFFSFGFAALNFSHPERNAYRYKMEPFDEEWRHTDAKNPYAPYTNLPPGTYKFMVMGANNDGLWNNEPAIIEVVMRPPWWATWWFRILAVAFVGGGIYMYYLNRLRRLQRQKRELIEQVKQRTAEIMLKNQELEQQQASIVRQNEKIQSSINYAQRIQKAMLPINQEMQALLKDYFVLFRPRDIVSGDFYWLSSRGNKVLLAAVDCTGHGVPGAFMSMIGLDLLKETVNMRGITDPSQVLYEMHEGVRQALHQNENRNRDGMDMSFCVFETLTSGNIRVDYAGAHHPLVYIQHGELKTLSATRLPIGGFDRGEARVYEKHTIEIDRPTWIYLFSDGYQDQFGGEDGRKLMSKTFKRLLLQIHQRPMEEQKALLEMHLEEWKQDREQTDDVMVIGIKLDKVDSLARLTQMGMPEFLLHK